MRLRDPAQDLRGKMRGPDFSPPLFTMLLTCGSRPGGLLRSGSMRGLEPSILRVPEDHVAALLAFDGREVRIDPAGADLRVCERDRDIFAA